MRKSDHQSCIRIQLLLHLALAAVFFLAACGQAREEQSDTAAQRLEVIAQRETAVAQELVRISQTEAALSHRETPNESQSAKLPTLSPTPPNQMISTSSNPTGNELAALASETIPDLTPLAPGEIFIKKWTLHNIGTTTWTTAYALVFVGGTQMNAPDEIYLPVPVAPGRLIEIPVTMRAPYVVGTYQGFWMLRNERGQLLGVGADGSGSIWVKILVSPDPSPVP